MEHIADVSELEPCEPLRIILDRVQRLPQGDFLRVIHRMEPLPLYGMLTEMGFVWRTTRAPEQVEILIWRRDDDAARAQAEAA